MKAITFDFCVNLGGLYKTYAIPVSAFKGITSDYTSKKNILNLHSDENVIEIYCTVDTLQFSEEKTQTASGSAYNPVVSGVIPKANELNQEQLTRLESDYWLLLFEDNNGNMRLAGNEDSHMVFNRDETTGQGMQNRNQTQFTFSGFQSHPCLYIHEVTKVY